MAANVCSMPDHVTIVSKTCNVFPSALSNKWKCSNLIPNVHWLFGRKAHLLQLEKRFCGKDLDLVNMLNHDTRGVTVLKSVQNKEM